MTEDPLVVIATALEGPANEEAGCRSVSSYVALGDSFTAGTGCPPGLCWADRIAAALRSRDHRLVYRNLAADGATSRDVVLRLDEAIELEPDLVTVICGANDVLRSTRPDARAYERRLTRIIGRLRNAIPSIAIATATSPEGWDFVPLGPRTRARVESGMRRFNGVTRRLSVTQGIPCFDVVGHPWLKDRDNFAVDGLHPSVKGHARAAAAFAQLLRDHHGIAIGQPEGDRS